MSIGFQVSFDAASPRALGNFWTIALGYQEEAPPPDYDSWESWLVAMNIPRDRWDDVWAIRDPDGSRPRILFQKVPEAKSAKNRVHLDVNVGHGIADADERWDTVTSHADRLIAAGASLVEERRNDLGDHWMVMTDPDGNEFCVQ